MRFLCVQCDEALAFEETRGPEDGSLTAIFRCPRCGRDIAMLTNPQETQIMRSLHVQLGGRTAPHEPLEAIRGSLSHMQQPEGEVAWTHEAVERLERVPDFVRPMVKTGIEEYARRQGYPQVTAEVMGEARGKMGM